MPAAPAGSTSIFERSRASTRPRDIDSSLTVRISTWRATMMSNGTRPGRPTAMPSAIVPIRDRATGCPAASDAG